MTQQPELEPDFENMDKINELAGLAISDLATDIDTALQANHQYTEYQELIREMLPLVSANPEKWSSLSILWHNPRSLVLAFHDVIYLANQRRDPYEYFVALVDTSLNTHSLSFDIALNIAAEDIDDEANSDLAYRIEMASVLGIIYASIFNSLKPTFEFVSSYGAIHTLIQETIDDFGKKSLPSKEQMINPDLPYDEREALWKEIVERHNQKFERLKPFKNAIKDTMTRTLAFYG